MLESRGDGLRFEAGESFSYRKYPACTFQRLRVRTCATAAACTLLQLQFFVCWIAHEFI